MVTASVPYSKVFLESGNSVLSALNVFAVPDTHTSVIIGVYVEVYPIDGTSQEGLIEFKIEGSQELYIDSINTFLELLVQAVNHDGSAFNADPTQFSISLGDNFFHSMFEKVTVRLAE